MRRHLLILLMCLSSMISAAQGDIQFSILPVADKSLPQTVADALTLKLKQIMTRNNAASANRHNVFGIEAEISIDDTYTSAGLMDQVSFAKGTLTLVMTNTVDGSLYHSAEFDLTGDASGGTDKALRNMVTSIKTKDPQFTRFIRVGRQRIAEYYAKNCPYILSKAQNLVDVGRYEEAQSYLSAISETLPCFEQASAMMRQLHEYTTDAAPDTVVIEKTVVIPIERVVEKPVPADTPQPTPEPEPQPAPQPEPTPSIEGVNCNITISEPDFDCRVIACRGDKQLKTIAITVEMTNRNTDRNQNEYSALKSVIDCNGRELKSFGVDGSYNIKMPPHVTVRRTFYVKNIYERIPSLSYVEFLSYATVTIRDLPVSWEE